jgi:hypothetical protein
MYDCFGLCNVVTAFKPPPLKRNFARISKLFFVLKGGIYSLIFVHWKQLNRKIANRDRTRKN